MIFLHSFTYIYTLHSSEVLLSRIKLRQSYGKRGNLTFVSTYIARTLRLQLTPEAAGGRKTRRKKIKTCHETFVVV